MLKTIENLTSLGEVKNNNERRRLKMKPIKVSRGNQTVTIRYEEPRDGRLPYRLEWEENGEDRSEMYETLEKAKTGADLKLTALTSGQRVMTKEEVDDLFGFQQQVETLNERLESAGRTLDQVISDVVAAAELLPGWTAAAMAQFIRENHGVKNLKNVAESIEAYIEYLKSGYKRKYSSKYIRDAKNYLGSYAGIFGSRRIDLVESEENLNFINGYRVEPDKRTDPATIGQDGLAPASQKTRNNIYNYLDQLFKFAKQVLGALPKRLATAIEMLKAPEFITPTPEIYDPGELMQLYGALPDIECILFVSLQLFSGLRPCEAQDLEVKDLRRNEKGKFAYIYISQELAKKDPKTGKNKVRTRRPPITGPLLALLAQIQLPKSGKLFQSRVAARILARAEAVGLRWKYDGLRHSFVAYRLESTKNRSQVAKEAGHEIPVQIEHYEGLIEDLKDVATYWDWKIDAQGLPFSLNHKIVGTKFVRQYRRDQKMGTPSASSVLAATTAIPDATANPSSPTPA